MTAQATVKWRLRVDGSRKVSAAKFNQRYSTGSVFIYQPCKALRGGKPVKTVDVARDLKSGITVVEINQEPYFANIKSLTPTGS